MKEFKIVQYKECPSCGFRINPEVKHAYDNNWCPHCGFSTKYGLDKIGRPKPKYENTGYDDAVRSGLL